MSCVTTRKAVVTPKRRLLTLPLLALGTLILAACGTITATGEGTVVVTSDNTAMTYDPGTTRGTIARVCAANSPSCLPSDAYLFSYYPAGGTREWTVYPGFPVVNRSGQTVGLPAGQYTLQATDCRGIGPTCEDTNVIQINVFSTGMDLTLWHQSHGRVSSESSCEVGWQPSWASWPNDGAGGFVCNREIYAYYPDVPVKTAGSESSSTPWMQSVARARADETCPDGYTPGWAQWPNASTGGFVCNRTVT